MFDVTRRRLLQAGAALGLSGFVSSSATADEHTSIELEKFKHELSVPKERSPDGKRRGGDYHEIPIEETTHSFHPDLPDTTIWGFDGQFPGPILSARKGERLAVEFDNSELPDEHLLEVDERIDGTTTENYVGYDGPVPEVRNSTHFHGLNVPPESDGQADMWVSPDGVEGPRRSRDVQVLPNRQSRLTSTYHDHTRGLTRLNNYAGLVGPYYIRSPKEEKLNLPDGEYDIPLVLADRSFNEDGSLDYPNMFMADVSGDTATVNGAAWPYLEVEPRRYRFRIINVSNARTFDLGLEKGGGHGDHDDGHGDHDDGSMHSSEMDDVPTLYQISPGHGFLEDVVSIGHHGDMHSLLLSPFERADVIVDFSEYAGETFTVTNDAEFPYAGGTEMDHDDGMMHSMDDHDDDHDDGHGGHGDMDHPQLPEIMQIRVASEAEGTDTSADPTELTLPNRNGPNPNAARTTREITMSMGMDDEGLMAHWLNDSSWGDPVEIKPQLGSTEIWELRNDDHHTHPIHLHLVEFEVIDRERHDDHDDHDDMEDMSGDDDDHNMDHPTGPLPNEKGGKDVVRVDPGETVRIAVKFGDFAGRYPFHCHVLEHEDHDMMRPFEVVKGNSAGNSATDNQGRGDDDHPGRGHGLSK
ncbi:multicopper oxidase domain-containing protein [Halobacteria archaeon AArc-curdl1]|uniref:Multicopper oxidase domain-containing protein n=1 Tax=Natronosalvus hydrolyticus TaxID=2979988 RepID=A0AAP3E5E5_9EURY|nr:multicopper oxidase domain-containing protein [Halobacteria archaeon AArc-curdl1]